MDCLRKACPHWELGTSYDGWVAALAREQERLVPLVVKRLRQEMLSKSRYQHSGRWLAFAVDGSEITCPRTLANQQTMGERGQPDGMPLASLTAIQHLGLGLPWDFRVGPGSESERAHLRTMIDDLPRGSLLVADAGFIGYDLCGELLAGGRHFLLRIGGNVHLLRELGYACDADPQTVYLWPLDQQTRNQPPLRLRLVVVQDEGKQPVYLVTSVLDPSELTDLEARGLFIQRWGIEVHFRTVKQTMGHYRLGSRTPDHCYLEMTWAFLGTWLLEVMTVEELIDASHEPSEISPAQARTAVRRAMGNECPRPRSRHSLCRVLANCRKDRYVRRHSKAARNYPRKKRQKPPSPPKVKLPTAKQLQRAKELTPINTPAKSTA